MNNPEVINITFKCGFCEKEFIKDKNNINVSAVLNTFGVKEIGIIEAKCPHCKNINTVKFEN